MTIFIRLRKIGKNENFKEKDQAEQQINLTEKKLKLDVARKQILKTISEANDVRYFYTLNKENEQHIGFVTLEKAISTALLSDRNNINELENNEINLSRSIEQVNIYLSRRYLHTKMKEASEMIGKLSTDHLPNTQDLTDLQDALKNAQECHANYLSTACEIRNAFDQLTQAIQVVENQLQLT